MKQGIHPNYYQATVTCNCGNTFVTGSTKEDIHVEILSIQVSRSQLRHVVVSSSLTVDMVLRLNNKIKKYYLLGGVRQVSGSF
mgnify:CR=1 FL=1